MPLKTHIHTILPLALATILPGLGLYANPGAEIVGDIGFLLAWLLFSLLLYMLWYLLWHLWDVKAGKANWWRIVGLAAGIGFLSGAVILFYSDAAGGLKGLFMIRIMLAGTLFAAIQYALKAQQHIARLQLEKEQVQTENYRSQLQALQAKVDPHFLFNSLNTLRSLVRLDDAKADTFIMSLSGFYRQTLKYNEASTMPLSEELAVLRSYLFLMASRNEEAVSVDMDVDRRLRTYHLPTLALQVVAENCFKHNSMTVKKPLRIAIGNTDDRYIVVRNNKQPRLGEAETSGLGLDLLRKRYALMNVEDGVLVEETPDQFTVKLKLL